MKAYKGFNKDMTCTPNGKKFQYEEGKTYTEDRADLCNAGFHACEDPIDCLSYYDPAKSVYHEVSLEEVNGKRSEDTKVCGKKITIGAEINLAGIAKAHVKYVNGHLDKRKTKKQGDDCSAATNTGNWSAATNTGDRSAATNTGNCSAATNTGNCSAATNTGNWSAATNTGDCSAATNTGDRSAATNTGNCSAATNTGNWSAATNTGYCSAATNTGYCSAATNTGDRSAATNTGDCSAATNTGDRSAATNTGNWSAATNTGNWSAAEVSGLGSIAVVGGYNGKAKASLGSAICICERGEWNGKTYPLLAVKAAIIDGEKLKADTWYTLEHGEFVEVEDDG